MKHWNRTGKIKAIFLVVLSLPNLLAPIGANPQSNQLISILVPFVFGSIAIPLITKFNSVLLGREIVKPRWNDNPLTFKSTLSFFHFGAFFFLAIGLSMVVGVAIKFQSLSQFGLTSIFFGIGILTGINLTIKWLYKKE